MVAALVLSLASCLVGQTSADPPPSLEDLLERLRVRRSEVHSEWAPAVANLLEHFLNVDADGLPVDLDGLRRDLDSAAAGAPGLLVPWIDPGSHPSGSDERRAEEIAAALERVPVRGITRQLLEVARDGTLAGRLLAVDLLGRSEDPKAVGPSLRRMFRADEDRRLVLAVGRALLLTGGEENLEAVRAALRDPDPARHQPAALAVAKVGPPELRPDVLRFLGDARRSTLVVESLLDYFTSLPQGVDEEVALAFLEFVRSPVPNVRTKVRVLERLPDLGLEGRDTVEALRSVLDTAEDDDVADAARICLAVLGDRAARKRVLLFYDRQIERDRSWSGGYEQRADVLVRMRDYGNAARDYKKAIDLSRDVGKPTRELRVKLARSYARDGKWRAASEALRSAALHPDRLRELAEDTDFVELAAHARYGKIFERP